MTREIKILDVNDAEYVDSLELNSELAIYIQQLKILFGTEIGEVLGAQDLSLNLEEYVWETNVDAKQLQELIQLQIHKYCTYAPKFRTDINVSFLEGEIRDVCIIDILINSTRLRVILR